jgi:hypothetical protein
MTKKGIGKGEKKQINVCISKQKRKKVRKKMTYVPIRCPFRNFSRPQRVLCRHKNHRVLSHRRRGAAVLMKAELDDVLACGVIYRWFRASRPYTITDHIATDPMRQYKCRIRKFV